jgi:hypothetical protein
LRHHVNQCRDARRQAEAVVARCSNPSESDRQVREFLEFGGAHLLERLIARLLEGQGWNVRLAI